MIAYFTDTSAITKHYVEEVGSAWVTSWAARTVQNIIVISKLTTVEFTSVIGRRVREGSLQQTDFSMLRAAFLNDVDEFYLTVDVDDDVLSQARDLLAIHPLRALDAIQLACALRSITVLKTSLVFVSADVNLLNAATAEGLTVENPNLYP